MTNTPSHRPISLALLGATGRVGQKAIRLCMELKAERVASPHSTHSTHSTPSTHSTLYAITLDELSASSRKVGLPYGSACRWRETPPLPRSLAEKTLIDPSSVTAPWILSALPSDPSRTLEPLLADRGHNIVTNASALRMEPDIPLIIPEINPSHLSLLERQKRPGKIIANPNCTAATIAPALAPLLELASLSHLSVVSLQALSGAGYPGISSLDALGNAIPFIRGEEEKVACELRKIFGTPETPADFTITVNCNRVPVQDGHMVILHAHFTSPVDPNAAYQAYREWEKRHPGLYLLHSEEDAPQPRLHLTENDDRVHIGRIRQGGDTRTLSVVALAHNLVRGAAGAALANLKLCVETCL